MGLILFVRAVVTILNVIKKLFKIQIKTDYLCHICQCKAIDPPYCFPNLVLSSPNADKGRLPGLHEILAMIDRYVVHNTLPGLPYISIRTVHSRQAVCST